MPLPANGSYGNTPAFSAVSVSLRRKIRGHSKQRKPIFRKNAAVEPEKAQAYFSSIGQELRALELPVYPGTCPDGVVDSYIAATWQDSGEVFTNNYCGESAQSIFTLLVAFAEETEAGIFSRPAPDGGWKCPECGMPNGSSVFCAECGARRPAE